MKKRLAGKKLRGLTLVELAIVLGVVGLVLGAIWVAGSAVRQKQEVERGVEIVSQVASRARALYTAFPKIDDAETKTVAKQIKSKLFPEDILNESGDNTESPWGGKVNVGFKRFNSVIVGFTVAMTFDPSVDLSARNALCVNLVSRLQGTGRKGVGLSEDPPIPDDRDASHPFFLEDLSPDTRPMYAYVSRSKGKGGGWHNVTGLDPSEVIDSDTPCTGVAFFFKL